MIKPINIELNDGTHLLLVPNVDVHLNGHVAIFQNYSIYAENKLVLFQSDLPQTDNPDYRGKLVFEVPGRLFNYIADDERLGPFEMQELVEKLIVYRDNAGLWPREH